MKVRNILSAICVISSLVAAGPVFATPLDLPDVAENGQIQIKFQNYESFGDLRDGALQVGSTNFGVILITSILTAGGQSLYSEPTGTGTYLVGVFNGITVTSITPNGSGFITGNSGGTFNIYAVSALPSFAQGTAGYGAAGCSVGGSCYNGITNVGGTLVLSFNLVPGVDLAGDTIQAVINRTTLPVTGSASAYANITGGVLASEFLKGGFETLLDTFADLFLLDDFCANHTTGCGAVGNWADLSHDPLTANTIPEPSSVGILAAALSLFGFFGYRSRKQFPDA